MDHDMFEIPSRITDKDWHQTGLVTRVKDLAMMGKWFLFVDDLVRDSSGFTELDRTWQVVLKMVSEGAFVQAECSTGRRHKLRKINGIGVVECFTGDFTEVGEVRMAAQEIRAYTNHSRDMYYKLQIDSRIRKLTASDGKSISLYFFDERNRLYVRSDNNTWVLLEEGQKLEDVIPKRLMELLDRTATAFSKTLP